MTKDYAAPITNVYVIYGVLIAAMHDNYIGCQLLQHTYLTGYLMLRHSCDAHSPPRKSEKAGTKKNTLYVHPLISLAMYCLLGVFSHLFLTFFNILELLQHS